MPSRCKGFATLLVLLAFAHPIHAIAGPYEDGDAAFRRKEYAVAMERWRPLAEGDDTRAQAGIAALYLSGLGVQQDHVLALRWCERAAARGEPRGQYILGSMYRDGKGVEKDLVRALDLFRKAAEQDLHWAQYTLGLMYFMGEGIEPDNAEAYHWFALAAVVRDKGDEQVHATASYLLEQASAKLTTEQTNKARQRVSEWKAASASRDK